MDTIAGKESGAVVYNTLVELMTFQVVLSHVNVLIPTAFAYPLQIWFAVATMVLSLTLVLHNRWSIAKQQIL